MSSDALMRLQYLSQQINELIQHEQYRSSPSMSIPLRSVSQQGLNPHAKEFVSQNVKPQVRFSDILQKDETVYLTVGIGHYADGYPILSTCAAIYDGQTFKVVSCEDAPQMVGRFSDKPGSLLFQFIRCLKQARKLRHEPKVSVWRHCYVKRNGKHISFSRLSQAFQSQ